MTLLLAALLMLAPARVQALTLVEQGTGKAVIVVPASAMPAEDAQPKAKTKAKAAFAPQSKAYQAAESVQRYVEMMSGAKLPIVAEGSPEAGAGPAQILVGHTETAKKLGVKIPSGFDPSVRDDAFNEEGYVLKTVGKQIVVAGNEDGGYLGTIYAANALLEKLGCRWYFPGAWGEVVPESKTIEVPELNIEAKPDFPVRMIWLSGWVSQTARDREEYAKWRIRVGFSAGTFYPGVGDGSLAFLLPPDKYFETHPEFYAMNEKGERVAGRNGKGFFVQTTMLCLSNPEVYNESVRNLKARFEQADEDGRAGVRGFGISPPDGAPVCLCPECKKLSQNFLYPNYVHRASTSEEFFSFATRLAREFPDKYVSTMAYALREFPPQGVDIPRNVMVMYAPIANDVMHPHNSPLWRHVEFISMLKQYKRQTPHITIYDYNPGFLTGMWVPERDGENMAVNMPLYKEIGVRGFNREGRKAFMQTWISYYLNAKLMWDAHADVDAIKRDFYTTFFGAEAGPHVRAWWDACAQRLVESPMQAHEDWVINHVYDLGFVKGIQKHADAALAAKATDAQHKRVEAFALIADHLLAYAQMNDAEMRMDYVAAAAAAQRMCDNRAKLNAISSFFISPPDKASSFFAEGRKRKFEDLQSRIAGEKGTLVAPLPLEMKYTRDRFNEGVPMEWYAPGLDDSKWQTRNTFHLLDQQEPFEDAAGHDWQGYGWYRGTFKVGPEFADKRVMFWCGGITNEGWVWINGKYAGHKRHAIWWMHPHDFELDVTQLIKPNQVNTITIRVLKDSELGGVYRRGFFYSPKG